MISLCVCMSKGGPPLWHSPPPTHTHAAARPPARTQMWIHTSLPPHTHHEQQVVGDVAGRAGDGDLDGLLPALRDARVLLHSHRRLGAQTATSQVPWDPLSCFGRSLSMRFFFGGGRRAAGPADRTLPPDSRWKHRRPGGKCHTSPTRRTPPARAGRRGRRLPAHAPTGAHSPRPAWRARGRHAAGHSLHAGGGEGEEARERGRGGGAQRAARDGAPQRGSSSVVGSTRAPDARTHPQHGSGWWRPSCFAAAPPGWRCVCVCCVCGRVQGAGLCVCGKTGDGRGPC